MDNTNTFYLHFDGEKAAEADNLFYGKCAELCGPSHALMDFKVQTLASDEFDNWVTAMQEAAEEEQQPENELAASGAEVFEAQSCIACHAVSPDQGAGTSQGPNLATFGERSRVAGILEHDNDEEFAENIKEWIRDADLLKPGNKMTTMGVFDEDNLTDEDLDALTEYLMSLKVYSE